MARGGSLPLLVAAAVVLAAHGVLGHPVPGADQLGRGFDPATGADVGMIFKIDSAVPSNSALFPESTLPAGFVLSSSPEQLMAPKTKIVATYRSYVNMRSAQVGLPVSAGGFFALSDEAKNMQTILRHKYVAFTEQTVGLFKLKVQYALEGDKLSPPLRDEVMEAFNALPLAGEEEADESGAPPPAAEAPAAEPKSETQAVDESGTPGGGGGRRLLAKGAADKDAETEKKPDQYMEFVKRYGPYYVKSATFGGSLKQISKVPRAGRTPSREAIEDFCDNKLRLRTAQTDDKSTIDDPATQRIETDEIVIGGGKAMFGHSKEDMSGWVSSLKDNPTRIKTVLAHISEPFETLAFYKANKKEKDAEPMLKRVNILKQKIAEYLKMAQSVGTKFEELVGVDEGLDHARANFHEDIKLVNDVSVDKIFDALKKRFSDSTSSNEVSIEPLFKDLDQKNKEAGAHQRLLQLFDTSVTLFAQCKLHCELHEQALKTLTSMYSNIGERVAPVDDCQASCFKGPSERRLDAMASSVKTTELSTRKFVQGLYQFDVCQVCKDTVDAFNADLRRLLNGFRKPTGMAEPEQYISEDTATDAFAGPMDDLHETLKYANWADVQTPAGKLKQVTDFIGNYAEAKKIFRPDQNAELQNEMPKDAAKARLASQKLYASARTAMQPYGLASKLMELQKDVCGDLKDKPDAKGRCNEMVDDLTKNKDLWRMVFQGCKVERGLSYLSRPDDTTYDIGYCPPQVVCGCLDNRLCSANPDDKPEGSEKCVKYWRLVN